MRVAPRALLTGGLLVAAAGMLLMTRLQPDSGYAPGLLPALVLCGIGMGLGFVPLTAVATSGVEGRNAGLVSGLLSTCQQVGGAIGIAVLVTLASDRTAELAAAGTPQLQALTDGFHVAFAVNAAMLAGAALLAPAIGRVRVTGVPAPAA